MKLTKLITVSILLLFLLALCVVATGAAAASSGTLAATDALGVKGGGEDHILIFLNGSYDPPVRGLSLRVDYDESVAECIKVTRNSEAGQGVVPKDRSSGFRLELLDSSDEGTGIPTETWLWDITFKANQNDGSKMEVGLDLEDIGVSSTQKYMDVTTVQNGTFSTEDKVEPVIAVTTKSPVSSTFTITGTITDVGGMVGGQSKAQATLKNSSTHPAVVYDLLPLGGSAPGYSFNEQVTWPVEDGVTLTITATDAAGNIAIPQTTTIDVVGVGFSDFEPADGSHIRAIPEYIRAFMTEINPASVEMYLDSTTLPAPKDLKPDTSTGYAVNTTPIDDLADGKYWVNVSGTGTGSIGGEWFGNWTFTLDTVKPKITAFDIADSDGDGYIEAGEDLYLSWNADDKNFNSVALVDVAANKEFWSNTAKSGSKVTVSPIDVGNRDLEFRAYDKAGNYDSRAFHLYNNYMVWVNSTKVGEVSGIDTTYTAAKDLSRIDVSSIILHNACTVTLPRMSTLKRTVTNLGWVTSDTYVTADNTIDNDLKGNKTYQNAWVYDPDRVFDFTVKVPNTQKAVLVLAEANESYIAELIRGGKGGIGSVEYIDLIRKTVYVFIDGGWAKITVTDDGKINPGVHSGNDLSIASGGITATLCDADNQVNLDGAGYQLSTQKDKTGTSLNPITLPPGDYALAAIAMDGDRLGILAAMPVIVMESDTQGWLNVKEVVQGDDVTARFATPCERLGVVLIRDVVYEGNALIDAVTLGKDTLHLNLTYNNIPATQKLIGNIYVSPSSGKYAVSNTNQTTISTSGLEPDSYWVYMVGQSAKGTVQAYGLHPLTITAKTPVEPTPPYTPGRSSSSSGSPYTTYTGTGTLQVNNMGTVLRSIKVGATDNIGSILVPIGVKALDKDGNPLPEITLTPLASGDLPAVPSGALFSFAGYVYEAGPAGATFDPAITLTFDIPEDIWNSLDTDNNDLVVKWYNEETGEWEDVPTTVYKGARSVDAKITHFSIFALFTEPVTTPTEPTTPTTPTEPPTTPPAEGDLPADGFPMTTVLAIFAILVIVIAAGYFFMVRK